MEDIQVGQLIIYVVVLLFAVSVHEAAHAWMSYKFGDDTAFLLGRVTLNPVAHTDPIGTLLIPIANFILAAKGIGIPLLGWGKPTPVNPLRWRDKDKANIMVSLAGIMANTLTAIVALVILKVLQATGQLGDMRGLLTGTVTNAGLAEPLAMLLFMTITMNASLAMFNLLPFPPLDGGKVLYSILPNSMQPVLDFLDQYGFFILIALMWLGVFRVIFVPLQLLIYGLIF